jgi:RND family efflux transporter MFP subunit
MKINISESYYAKTNKNLDVALTFEAYEDKEFKGKIDIIYPTISPASHTFPVEISLENKDMKVRPGMYGKAIVNFGSVEHVVVPDEAVMKQAGSGDYYVYTYENGKVYNNKVTLGSRMDNRYELIDGIASGSQVVIAGKASLRNGIEVEVIE